MSELPPTGFQGALKCHFGPSNILPLLEVFDPK